MATVAPTWTLIGLPSDTGSALTSAVYFFKVTWANVNTADTCTAAPCGWLVDKSVQGTGTCSTLSISGSNDGVAYAILNDPLDNDLTFTLNGATIIEQMLENTYYIKPTMGTATSMTITVFGRVPQQ